MSYNHRKQYRCPIVRGKAIGELDDLLPAYAQIISEICPCNKDDFISRFNQQLSKSLTTRTKKTLNNHRTEIAGKLFGMFYESNERVVYASERALKLLEDSDQPAFFKDLCLKYQFPSGMNKINTVRDQIGDGISVRQLSLVMKVLIEAERINGSLTKEEIGYYVLNSLDALRNDALPSEIIQAIAGDRERKIKRKVANPGKASSYNNQHINEQLNLLALANCIILDGNIIRINHKEQSYINLLASKYNVSPEFDFCQYNLSAFEQRKKAEIDWDEFFSKLSEDEEGVLKTTADSLWNINLPETPRGKTDTISLGDDGEEYVYCLERSRVESNYPYLVNKIKKLGKIRGLGYDLQSVLAEGENPEFAKYIEVKSTKRVTPPSTDFNDTINLTRNEWMAAQQHKENFFIYRVYFSQNETNIFIIQNPHKLNDDGVICAVPITYRIEFNHTSGEFYES